MPPPAPRKEAPPTYIGWQVEVGEAEIENQAYSCARCPFSGEVLEASPLPWEANCVGTEISFQPKKKKEGGDVLFHLPGGLQAQLDPDVQTMFLAPVLFSVSLFLCTDSVLRRPPSFCSPQKQILRQEFEMRLVMLAVISEIPGRGVGCVCMCQTQEREGNFKEAQSAWGAAGAQSHWGPQGGGEGHAPQSHFI